jgi:hypothetical protein
MRDATSNASRAPKQAKAKRPFDVNYQRRRDIARTVVARHGRLAKAALCIPYAIAAAWHCPSDSERRFLMVQWCRWCCAPLSVEHQIDAILEANPARRISADTLARHLHVSDAERTALRIWTIGSYDVPKAKRIKRRKEKRRLANKARRQARGATPREQSFSRTKPWLKDGIGERQWRRRRKAMSEIRGHDASLLLPGHEFVSAPRCNGHHPGPSPTLRELEQATARKGVAEQASKPTGILMQAVTASQAEIDRVFAGMSNDQRH